MILGEIRRFFRDDGAIKVSRSLKELSLKARDAGEKLNRNWKAPTIGELAEYLGEEAENIVHAMEASRVSNPFQEYEDDDGAENRLIDRIISHQASDEADRVEKISCIMP